MKEDTGDNLIYLIIPLVILGILAAMFLPPWVFEMSWAVGIGLSFWAIIFLVLRKWGKKDTARGKNRQ